jgi:hypothetical protein
MTEIINLRLVRKAQRRAAAEQSAATNRARHGRTKAEKHQESLEKTRTERVIDGHQIEKKTGDD